MKRIKDEQAQERMNITGAGIRRARQQAGLTQTQLSARMETMAVYICRGSLSRIENGSRIVTDIELKAIADALRLPVESLFQEFSADGSNRTL